MEDKFKMYVVDGRRIPYPLVKDYLLIREDPAKSKIILVQVESIDPDARTMKCVIEKDKWKERKEAEFSFAQVLFNVGPNPPKDLTLFGNKLDPFIRAFNSKAGRVNLFREANDKQLSVLKKAIDLIDDFMDKTGLKLTFTIHIEEKRGQETGRYSLNGVEDGHDLMQLFMEDKDFNMTFLTWDMFHEMGHGIMWRYMPKDYQSAWVRAYLEDVKVIEVTDNFLQKLCNDFIKSKGTYEGANDQERMALDEVKEWIAETWNIDLEYVQVLVETEKGAEKLRSMWPKMTELTTQKPSVSEYAMKSVAEYFCESFSFSMIPERKRKLPERIVDLVEKTIKACMANAKVGQVKDGKMDIDPDKTVPDVNERRKLKQPKDKEAV